MDFLDEDSPGSTATREPSIPRRQRPARRPPRQLFLIRRAIAVGVGLLILVLLVLGVRGCLNARKERALEDYARNVISIVGESDQLSNTFFARLEDPGPLSVIEYEAEIKSDRSAAETLLTRAESLDVPGDMDQAHDALELTLEMRAGALTEISDRVDDALGEENQEEAVDDITNEMETLLASDVIYRSMAKPEIEAVLAREQIEGAQVPPSVFLPDIDWLERNTVEDALSQVSGAVGTATPGVHGLGLLSVAANGIALDEGVPATIATEGTPELDVQVQNQGESEESGITVSVQIDDETPIEQEIDTLAPGEITSVTIPISPDPEGEVRITVEVEPVPGEEVEENNEATYDVAFE